MKIGVFIAVFSTLVLAETIILDTIEIDEAVLPVGNYVLSKDEAVETNSITLQDRLTRDVAFSVTSDIIGEGAVSFRGKSVSSSPCGTVSLLW